MMMCCLLNVLIQLNCTFFKIKLQLDDHPIQFFFNKSILSLPNDLKHHLPQPIRVFITRCVFFLFCCYSQKLDVYSLLEASPPSTVSYSQLFQSVSLDNFVAISQLLLVVQSVNANSFVTDVSTNTSQLTVMIVGCYPII